MDPVTMMVASIGMQFFTQHATNKKSAEIQEKQREFQKAAAEHDFERMRRLQAESAKLALELEAEVHQERVNDINNNYDSLLENFAHSFAIQNWPLNVLPFVMKGESFGSLFNGTTKSVNMHCILTPSNCEWFNEMFYDDIDFRLEAEMNNNWNAQTAHPIVYYGGAWNRRSMRHGISVPNEINLVDIDLLKVKLKNVPVVVITPYFDPWLHFRVQLWGMGKDSDAPFRIDIPHGNDLEYSKRIFSYEYNKNTKDEMSKDFINTTIEEFVPYLESMIGFISDEYFWELYKLPPVLPQIIQNSPTWDNKLKLSSHSRYSYKLKQMLSSVSNPEDSIIRQQTYNHIISYIDRIGTNSDLSGEYLHSLNDTINYICSHEKTITNTDISCCQLVYHYNSSKAYVNERLKMYIDKKIKVNEFDYEIINIGTTDFSKIESFISKQRDNTNNCTHFYFCVWNKQILIGRFGMDNFEQCIYLLPNRQRYFIFYSDTVIDISQGESQYYKLEILTNKILKMGKKNFEERFGNEFAKIGKSLGRIIDSVDVNEVLSKQAKPSVWNSPQQTSKSNDYVDKIIAFFTQRVDENLVEAELVSSLSMKDFLDWIDKHYSAFASKAYIVKGYVQEKKKYLVCIFLANDETAFIGESDAAKCYVLNELNQELVKLFESNDVCEIPLK